MLRIVDVAPPEPGTLATERYLPIAVSFPGSGYYTWEVQSHNTSQALTVSINLDTGRIRRVTLPFISRVIAADFLPGYDEAPHIPGVPVVDISEFEALAECPDPPVITEERGFRVSGDGRRVVVALNPWVVPDRCVRADRVGFFVGSGFICGFGFFDLAAEEYATIVEVAARQADVKERSDAKRRADARGSTASD
jgi:hypothetical protein